MTPVLARIPSDIIVALVYDRLVSLRLSQFDYYLSPIPDQQQHYITVDGHVRSGTFYYLCAWTA